MSKQSTAGKGPPYWYEWSVGLLRVVDMLYPDSGISSVCFQETGIKGWDDVVVRFKDGKIEFTQVKHTREGNNLTFGSLVSSDENGDSLLKSLYDAWVELGYPSATARCRVFTNREAGERSYRNRPPLLKFFDWLKAESGSRNCIKEIEPPDEFGKAWHEWQSQTTSGSDETRLDFIRALTIETSQPDLEELQHEVCSRLGKALGISPEKALPLLQALNTALVRWTQKQHERITSEDAFNALTLPEEIDVLKLPPAPPAPFFHSREQRASELEQLLLQTDGPPVVFLSAAPGAGKTSLMSRIEMRRSEDVWGGVIDLRYFAFRPIIPEQQTAPSESDFYVDPKELWFSLLSQLRKKLRSKLAAYEVPVRNDLLSWADARRHVLRLANRLGLELGRKFIIAIDGIDHAARAGRLRFETAKAEDFFRSLPGPDELSTMQLRLLIAGQPAANYQEYPSWLKRPHPGVRVASLAPLDRSDIASLIQEKPIRLPQDEWDECVDLIAEETRGNTLAIVFAVAEATDCRSVKELRQRLHDRKLHEGLESYYSSIWRYALDSLADNVGSGIGIKEALAGTVCLLREPVSGSILHSTFPSLGLSEDQWTMVLRKLGPLIVATETGFQTIHNDVRVFLTREISGQSMENLAWVASRLADYYGSPASDRRTSHASLQRLLEVAGRSTEWAGFFNVDWVFEAAARGQSFGDVAVQAKAALRSAIELRDWDTLHELACSIECLERWENNLSSIPPEDRPTGEIVAPIFPRSEVHVLPFTSWTIKDLQQVANDVDRILKARNHSRAKELLKRWFSGLRLEEMADRFYRPTNNEDQYDNHNHSLDSFFESLGYACRQSGFSIEHSRATEGFRIQAEYHYEKGWAERSSEEGPFTSLARCFGRSIPRFIAPRDFAIRKFAESGKWRLVGRLLRCSHEGRNKFSQDFQNRATWWCVRSGMEKLAPGWLDPLNADLYGPRDTSTGDFDELSAIAKTRGWLEPAGDLSTLTDTVFSRSTYYKANRFGLKVPLRAAVMLGQASRLQARGDFDDLRTLIPPRELKQIIDAVWNGQWRGDYDPAGILNVAGKLTTEIVSLFSGLGEKHNEVLVQAALRIAAEAKGDYRAEGAWLVLKRAGKLPALRKWAELVLGEDGWLWKEEYSSRTSLGETFINRAADIGEAGLVESARRKLKWQRIGYRGHKDYSFRWPCRWFSQLAESSTTPVMDQGYQLLALAESCKEQEGDNCWSSEINEALGAAAIKAGPDHVWRLIFSSRRERGDWRWMGSTRQMILGGFEKWMAHTSPMNEDARIALWCLSIGLSRWCDNDDVESLASIRTRLLATAEQGHATEELEALLRRISPGEFVREPWKSSGYEDEVDDAADETHDDWEAVLDAGERLTAAKAATAVKALVRNSPPEVEQRLSQVLGQFGMNESLFGGWSYSDEVASALQTIVEAVPDSLLWSLAGAAILNAEEGGYWYGAVLENLNLLLLARATAKGTDELKCGVERLLRMHERWARGGDMSLPTHVVSAAEGPFVPSWEELAARTFCELFSSRYGVVLESAFVGTNALVTWCPTILRSLLNGCLGDPWRTRWLLSLLEVWVTERPEDLRPLEEDLDQLVQSGGLSNRLQAWIVKQLLERTRGCEPPAFPFIGKPVDEPAKPQLSGILYTDTDVRGSFRFVDVHESAASRLHRIESATELDFSDIGPRIGSDLVNRKDQPECARPWLQSVRNDPDFGCHSESGRVAVDNALDAVLAERIGDSELLNRFALGALCSDEGWILRNSPLPFHDASAWPRESLLEGRYPDPPTDGEVRRSLRETAITHEIADDEIVVAACFKAHSYKEDFYYYYWFSESEDSPRVSKKMPSTLSGRNFPWLLGSGWWEPELPVGSRTIAFKVGGLQELMLSFPEIIPSRLWIELFNWTPSATNPFLWNSGGETVARFEVRHGPPLEHLRNAGRQALLHRWIAKKDAFATASQALPSLRRFQNFSRFRFRGARS